MDPENTTNLVGIGVKQEDFESIKSNDKEYSFLGKGFFGYTEKMKSKLNNKIYAIKKLPIDIYLFKDFIRETSLMLQFNHANIVRLYGYFQGVEKIEKIKDIYKDSQNKRYQKYTDDVKMYFLVLDYAPHGNLENYLIEHYDKGTATEQDFIFKILKQILEGLKYLKKNNIIHKDVKLDNILLDENYNIKISSLGISAVYNDNNYTIQNNNLASNFAWGGPVQFVAPEILRHKVGMKCDFDYKVDIFSLGLIMLCLVSNTYPISFEKGKRKINKENTNKIYNEYLIGLIKRMCLQDQNIRPSVEEALEDLNKIEEYMNIQQIKKYLDKKNDILLLANPFQRNLIGIGTKQEEFESIKSEDKDNIILGKGFSGCFEKMKSKLNNKIYAIKKVPVIENSSNNFVRETTIMLRINHKNILKFYGYFQGVEKIDTKDDKQIYFLVFDYIPNAITLSKYINNCYEQKTKVDQ